MAPSTSPAKPTNWIESSHAALRAEKGQDEKVLVATCTSANGKPPGVLSWETRLKGEAEYQEVRNPNGTVTVVSRYRLVPGREAHLQPLACIVNYHLDRFRESITVRVQCEQGQVWRAGLLGGHHPFPPRTPQASLLLSPSLSFPPRLYPSIFTLPSPSSSSFSPSVGDLSPLLSSPSPPFAHPSSPPLFPWLLL